MAGIPAARMSVVAQFPEHSLIENLAVRADNSLLVTVGNRNELHFIAAPAEGDSSQPVLLHSFDQPTLCIIEIEPEIFLIATSNLYTTHESYLHRLDLRGWKPGLQPAGPETVLTFPREARGLNGGCMIAPGVVLIADCFAGMIWRVDIPADGKDPRCHVWLKHYSMNHDPNGGALADQPGVNGLRFDATTRHLYYTSTVHKFFMRVRVDLGTLAALGEPELVASGWMYDDFCIDENARVAYLTTHRENRIELAHLEPANNTDGRRTVAGEPFDDRLVGPSSGAWSRAPGEHGRVAFFTSDGGTKVPPKDGIVRPAKVLRVEFDWRSAESEPQTASGAL
jgi:hypothetical protein